MSFWGNKKVVLTGGGGFLGSHVAEALKAAGCNDVFIVRSREFDLTKETEVIRLFADRRATDVDMVIHLAGLVGGIGANKAKPADFFYRNLMMGTLMLHHAWLAGAKKFVAAGAGCGYPEHAPVPLKETTFWDGLPQVESAPYSLAKRLLQIQASAYWKQHGFPSIIGVPGNIYGPYDNFDLENAHVVPALVRKFVEGKDVVVWGSGKPTRDFVYAGDVARGLLLAGEKYDRAEVVNLSSGRDHSVREVVDVLVEATGFKGSITWDSTRPDGQIRRLFDVSKAQNDLGFHATTSLEGGLIRTVNWYRENRERARNQEPLPETVMPAFRGGGLPAHSVEKIPAGGLYSRMSTAATARQTSEVVVRPVSRPALMAGTLATADIFATGLAVILGFRVWSMINPAIPPFQTVMALAPLFCAAMFLFENLYPGIGMGAVEHIRRVFRGITLVYLMLTAAMFITKDRSWADSRGGFILSWAFSLALAPSARWLCGFAFGSRDWWGVPVMILGAGETGHRIIRNLNQNRVLGYHPVVCLDDDPEKHADCEGVPVVGCLRDAAEIAAELRIAYAVIAMPSMPSAKLTGHLRTWSTIFPNIVIIPDLFGIASLWIETRDLGGVLGLEIRHNLLTPFNRWLKRAVDIAVAALGLVAIAPFVPIVVLWIRLASPGRAFFVQEREGRKGKLIRIFKFRTMYHDAEQMLERQLAADPAARAEWDQFCKLKNDPRVISGIGRLLRKTSLDEIPQLWNILKGDMSLVGPRPFPTYHNDRFDPEFRALRTQVSPGLTGMWQVNARSDGDLDVQESLDSYYIRNWSLWLDLYLLIRTARVVFSGQGAY